MRKLLPPTSPQVWGPPTWESLHRLAAGYPDSPTPPVKRHCAAFLRAIPWMLPCESCGFHFMSFLENYEGGLELIVSCRPELVRFLVEAHNDVSARTRPEELPWTVHRAQEAYAAPVEVENCEPYPLDWFGRSGLVRSVESRGCGCKQ